MAYSFKRSALFCAALLGLWLGLKLLLPLLAPFFLGAALALMASPGAEFLIRRCRLPRSLASAAAVSALVACLGLLALLAAGLMVSQFSAAARFLPSLIGRVQSGIRVLENWMLRLVSSLPQGLQPGYRDAVGELFSGGAAMLGKISGIALGTAGNLLSGLPEGAVTLGTALVSAYMLCAKLPKIQGWILTKLPPKKLEALKALWNRLRSTGKKWFLSQLKLMGVTYCVLLCGFWLMGQSHAPFIALLTTLVDALPVLGTGTVLLPWAFICFLSGRGKRALGLLGLYAGAALLRSVLEPSVVGSHLGLDPLVTLIAMYCGYKLWGLAGMLLLPLLAATVFQALPESGAGS